MSAYPPKLRNKAWGCFEVEIDGNIHSLFDAIVRTRNIEHLDHQADTLGLVDAISSIYAHSVEINASLPEAAYQLFIGFNLKSREGQPSEEQDIDEFKSNN